MAEEYCLLGVHLAQVAVAWQLIVVGCRGLNQRIDMTDDEGWFRFKKLHEHQGFNYVLQGRSHLLRDEHHWLYPPLHRNLNLKR